MRILIDGRLYGLENAGLGRYLTNLILELSQIDSKNEYVLLLRKKYFDLLDLPANWKKVLADFRHYSIKEQLILPGIIKKENPDLVHFPHFNVPVTYREKYVVTIHDLLMHKQIGLSATTLPAPIYFLKRLAYRFVFDTAVKKSFAVIVPSFAVKNELEKLYKDVSEKINVTYEGLDENITTSGGTKITNPYFVYTGNAYPHKNLKRLIQAMVLLNLNRDEKINLLITSARNAFTLRVEKMIRELKAQDFVRLLGFVPDEELGNLYKNSLGLVFPSLSEGFGLPGLEAINSGTLLLASEIPVFREIYGKNAVYFNPLDFSSIEKAMRNVLEISLIERKSLIKKGQEFAKRYSWAKMAKETLKIYLSFDNPKGLNSERGVASRERP
jgi:glycosyltransferase involved in cell wall biosynthesis